MSENNEQTLVNIVFDIAFLIKESDSIRSKTDEELAEWIRQHLSKYSINTRQTRVLWGEIIKDDKEINHLYNLGKLMSSMSSRILESNRLLENIHMTLRRIEEKR